MSLVSKAWFTIADEQLWRSLPSLLPLLKLFLEDTREVGEVYWHVPTVRFLRTLDEHDWEPALRRSCHVKVIDAGLPKAKMHYDRTALEALAACPSPSSFLPALKTLILPDDIFSSAKDIAEAVYQTLLSPHLASFGISRCVSGNHTFDWDPPLLEGISRACPKVSRLIIDVVTPHSSLFTVLEHWTRLRSVQMKLVGLFDLSHILGILRGLPSLLSLEIDLGGTSAELTDPPIHNACSLLQELTVSETSALLAFAITRWLGVRHLRLLRLLYVQGRYMSDTDMLEMMQYIGSQGSSTLSHVEFRLADGYDCELSPECLSPLSSFRDIRYLAISGYDSLLTEADYNDCARWWPELRTFELDVYRNDGCIRCSLEVLLAFAEHCPHLNSLTVPLDAIKSPPAIPQSLRHASLIYLDVLEGAEINDLRQVALFLHNLFPNLETVATSFREEPNEYYDYGMCWFAVSEIVNVLRMVKERGV
ncbi:hypothetical protein FB107DRAFT_273509 [Schizophyllum commune]